MSPPTSSISVPATSNHRTIEFGDSVSAPRKASYHRERAITLTGDESKPATPTFASQPHLPSASILSNPNYAGLTTPLKTPNPGWRASTGRNDLSQRQLWLLKDMLNSGNGNNSSEGLTSSGGGGRGVPIPSSEARILEENGGGGGTSVNRGWKWGADAMESTVTLPSEESAMVGLPSSYNSATGIPAAAARATSTEKKQRRMSRMGMSGLRDMLKSLTRNVASGTVMGLPSAAISTESSLDSHGQSFGHGNSAGGRPPSRSGGQSISGKSSQRRRARTSTGPESISASIRAMSPPFNHSASYTGGSSSTPRRPSLASIFRFSQRSKSGSGDSTPSNPDVVPVPRAHGHTQESSGSESNSGGSAWDAREVKHGDDEEEEEDWDRVESSEDVEMDMDAKMLGMSPSSTVSGGGGGSDGSATIRGRKSMSPWKRKGKSKSKDQNSFPDLATVYKRPEQASTSSSSLAMWAESAAAMSTSTPPQIPHGLPVPPPIMTSGSLSHASSLSRPTRLSNVEETPGEFNVFGQDQHTSTPKSKSGQQQDRSRSRHSPHRPSSRTGSGSGSRSGVVSGSVRSAPSGLQDALSSSTSTALGKPKLAMTPENIKPLLENAKEVHARCEECIGEIKDLLAASRGEVEIGLAS